MTDPDQWRVIDHDNDGNVRTADSKSDAEEKAATAKEFGSDNVDIVPPGEPLPVDDVEADGGQPMQTQEGMPKPVEAEPVEPSPEPRTTSAEAGQPTLPERDVGTDPISWMPSDFIDHIDGSPAVNRKGFEVLSHFYDISVAADLEVAPEETSHEYCRVKATAETPDGRTCEAFGSAHVDRGDDAEILLEMAGTRARKRALSIATGVGAVAIEELKNETKAEMEASD